MIWLFDLMWVCGAVPVYGVAGAAGGSVLWLAGQHLGWPWAFAAFPVAYLAFLLALVAVVSVVTVFVPREREGTCNHFHRRT